MVKAKKITLRGSQPVMFASPANAWVYVNRQLHGNRTPNITVRAPVNVFTGFGQVARNFAESLAERYPVSVVSTTTDTSCAKLPVSYARLLRNKPRANWELRIEAVGSFSSLDKSFVLYTMWEAPVLPEGYVDYVNKALMVCVPTVWNADIFAAAGVKVPIRVVPLGVDPARFPYAPMQMRGPCVFGVAGNMGSGGSRKGLNETIAAFLDAFPLRRYPDVRLRVKCFPSCPVIEPADPRIDVTRKCLSPKRLTEWFSSLTALVSAANAGGWELIPHQALLTGRPVIGHSYGGIGAYFDSRYFYPVTYSLTPATGWYKGRGHWAVMDKQSLHAAMHAVYSDRKTAQAKGREGAKAMKRFTEADSASSLHEALRSTGLL